MACGALIASSAASFRFGWGDGLPDNAVKESRERIKSALRNCEFEFPHRQGVTINLAPADVRKEGSGFDLPMALGLVGRQGQFFGKQLDKMMFLGELSLDGSVRSVRCQRLLQRGSSG